MPWPLLGLACCGACGRPLNTHTIRRGSIVYRYYRCRSTAGGREPCKGVLVGAHELESAVLQAAGIEQTGLTSKEEEAALQCAIRQVVFKADAGTIEIESKPRSDTPDEVVEPTLDRIQKRFGPCPFSYCGISRIRFFHSSVSEAAHTNTSSSITSASGERCFTRKTPGQ